MKLDLLQQLIKPGVHDVPIVPTSKKPVNIGLYPNSHQGQNISDTSLSSVPYTGHFRTHTENPIFRQVSRHNPSNFEHLKSTGHLGHTGHHINNELTQKEKTLIQLIKQISNYYGGDDEVFLSEYISDVLSSTNIDEALTCFHDLTKHIPAFSRK
jgi:hypothetical protein